jgi:hypothetical protein
MIDENLLTELQEVLHDLFRLGKQFVLYRQSGL